MKKNITTFIVLTILAVSFSGCIVGDVVAVPFRVTGAVLNTVTPDIVGDSVTATGDALDTVIPF